MNVQWWVSSLLFVINLKAPWWWCFHVQTEMWHQPVFSVQQRQNKKKNNSILASSPVSVYRDQHAWFGHQYQCSNNLLRSPLLHHNEQVDMNNRQALTTLLASSVACPLWCCRVEKVRQLIMKMATNNEALWKDVAFASWCWCDYKLKSSTETAKKIFSSAFSDTVLTLHFPFFRERSIMIKCEYSNMEMT